MLADLPPHSLGSLMTNLYLVKPCQSMTGIAGVLRAFKGKEFLDLEEECLPASTDWN